MKITPHPKRTSRKAAETVTINYLDPKSGKCYAADEIPASLFDELKELADRWGCEPGEAVARLLKEAVQAFGVAADRTETRKARIAIGDAAQSPRVQEYLAAYRERLCYEKPCASWVSLLGKALNLTPDQVIKAAVHLLAGRTASALVCGYKERDEADIAVRVIAVLDPCKSEEIEVKRNYYHGTPWRVARIYDRNLKPALNGRKVQLKQ